MQSSFSLTALLAEEAVSVLGETNVGMEEQ